MQTSSEPDTVLDVGCGVGALHISLLEAGAGSAHGVDISQGMLEHAARFAQERGFSDQVTYHRGDLVELGEAVPAADITVMDKVVCCYENVEALIQAVGERTRRVLAITYPRDSIFIRTAFELHRLVARLFRWKFHPCWHDWHAIRDAVQSQGFEQADRQQTFLWEAVVFRRSRPVL